MRIRSMFGMTITTVFASVLITLCWHSSLRANLMYFNDIGLCLATINNVNIPAPTKAWNVAQSSWVYTWNWSVTMTCGNNPNPNNTACSICVYNVASRDFGCDGGPFQKLSSWYANSATKLCNSQYQISFATVFPSTGAIVAGNCYDVDFYVAAFNPALGGDCTTQNYNLYQTYDITCPPNGP